MRVLALDIGEKRIGVAVSDTEGRVAMPLRVVDARRALGDGAELVRMAQDYEVDRLVVGLPIGLDGVEGRQAARVRRDAERLARFLRLPVDYVDERFTSAEAERRMRETGADSRAMRGSIDMVAAAVLLQAYLDARREDEDAR